MAFFLFLAASGLLRLAFGPPWDAQDIFVAGSLGSLA